MTTSKTYILPQPFTTESGEVVRELQLSYCTWGTYTRGKTKVAWICHALTANADAAEWWPELIGEGKAISPADYFIVCANIPGSCYGSTGSLSIDPTTGKPYYDTFPLFTIRDIVRSFIQLRRHQGIEKIDLLVGGSMGGYQCLEWAITEPDRIAAQLLLATSAKESAWGIAIHTTQRLALETDPTFGEKHAAAGANGLKTARAIGMLTYRSYMAFVATQTDTDDRITNFRASSYIHHQGDKLVKRFNAYSYHLLTRIMDSHNVGRGRNGIENALHLIQAKTLCIGITSDLLCPVQEQRYLAKHIPEATYLEIDSAFGHDGFLVEGKLIGQHLERWLTGHWRKT
jgi:homoserine O-acetyltransferase